MVEALEVNFQVAPTTNIQITHFLVKRRKGLRTSPLAAMVKE